LLLFVLFATIVDIAAFEAAARWMTSDAETDRLAAYSEGGT
jgi:hypothetical protein